eukprot:1064547-Pleurochrysis_carterae.AAC.2
MPCARSVPLATARPTHVQHCGVCTIHTQLRHSHAVAAFARSCGICTQSRHLHAGGGAPRRRRAALREHPREQVPDDGGGFAAAAAVQPARQPDGLPARRQDHLDAAVGRAQPRRGGPLPLLQGLGADRGDAAARHLPDCRPARDRRAQGGARQHARGRASFAAPLRHQADARRGPRLDGGGARGRDRARRRAGRADAAAARSLELIGRRAARDCLRRVLAAQQDAAAAALLALAQRAQEPRRAARGRAVARGRVLLRLRWAELEAERRRRRRAGARAQGRGGAAGSAASVANCEVGRRTRAGQGIMCKQWVEGRGRGG